MESRRQGRGSRRRRQSAGPWVGILDFGVLGFGVSILRRESYQMDKVEQQPARSTTGFGHNGIYSNPALL